MEQREMAVQPAVNVQCASMAGNTADKVERLRQALKTNPDFHTVNMAAELGITRQTLHSWVRKIQAGEQINRKGRPLVFEEKSKTLSVRVPDSLSRSAVASVRQKVREMVCELRAQANPTSSG